MNGDRADGTKAAPPSRTKRARLHRRAAAALLIVCWHFFCLRSFRRVPPPTSNSTYFAAEDGPIQVHSPPKSDANVAICLIVKNETLYLDEWIDYHIALGFAPIFIYDNMLYEDIGLAMWYQMRDDIHPYVQIIRFPEAPVQKAAYNRCIRQDAKNSTFVGLFDVDEFLVLKKHSNVVDFMEEYCNEDCGQLGINWRVMSASGEERYRPLPITKRNVNWSNLTFQDGSVKVILRPSYVTDEDMDWAHTVILKRGFWIDTNGTVIPRPGITGERDSWRAKQNHHGPTDVALFYHYRWKSEEEYKWKTCHRGNSLHVHDDFPHCGGRVERIGMYNVPSRCGEYIKFAQLAWKRNVSACGAFDDTAWRHMKKLVPRYAMKMITSCDQRCRCRYSPSQY